MEVFLRVKDASLIPSPITSNVQNFCCMSGHHISRILIALLGAVCPALPRNVVIFPRSRWDPLGSVGSWVTTWERSENLRVRFDFEDGFKSCLHCKCTKVYICFHSFWMHMSIVSNLKNSAVNIICRCDFRCICNTCAHVFVTSHLYKFGKTTAHQQTKQLTNYVVGRS